MRETADWMVGGAPDATARPIRINAKPHDRTTAMRRCGIGTSPGCAANCLQEPQRPAKMHYERKEATHIASPLSTQYCACDEAKFLSRFRPQLVQSSRLRFP